MKSKKEKKSNERLENFDLVLNARGSIEAPYPEPEKTGVPGLLNALEKPLRELLAERQKDRKRDIEMGGDKDFELEL